MDLLATLKGAGVQGGEQLFRNLMLQISVIAAFIHVAFSCLFFSHNIWLLGVVNVFSVLLYVVVFFLILTRRYHFSAWAAVVFEILGHAALAVFLLGWDSGFHFYAMVIPPVVMISPLRDGVEKMPLVMGMMMLYVIMDYMLRHVEPVYDVSSLVLNSLYYFNLITVLTVMVFLSGLYYRLVVNNERKLRQLATTDPLTGLLNRRSLHRWAQREIRYHQKNELELAVLLCDLDHFKQVNDLFGHQTGDAVIQNFSEVLKQELRNGDYAARWGGEEFLLLLPATTANEAMVVAERIRSCLEKTSVTINDHEIFTTTTIGIAELLQKDSFDQLVGRADQALYRGKGSGRNQVVNP